MSVAPGDVIWVDFGETIGREQHGGRPAVVVGAHRHRAVARELVIVVPCTSRDRGWRAHLPLHGEIDVDRPTFAMTEQPRTVSVRRLGHHMGTVHARCRQDIALAVRNWLEPPPPLRG